MKASINSIESCGTVDGPGIRTVIFFNECLLRCKYCHNPEMWHKQPLNYEAIEISNKIKRYKPYYGNTGGVTLSGGEPLLHSDFIIELAQILKEDNIHIALDTAGYGLGNYEKVLENIDLIIFDIKDINEERFKNLTGGNINRVYEFLEVANKFHKKFWLRQVIVPGIHDNQDFLLSLNDYIKKHFNIKNIEKIEFLPYHKLGSEKYLSLGIDNPYKDLPAMDETKCANLYQEFMNIYNKK